MSQPFRILSLDGGGMMGRSRSRHGGRSNAGRDSESSITSI